MTVEELQVLVTARTRGLEQQMSALTNRLQGVQRQSNTMGANMTRTFTNLKRTLIGLGIGKAIKSMFDLSRNYEASVQQVNRMFRDNAGAIEAWIQKNATTFGMARADAMDYARIYGNLVRGFEKDTSKMADYTTQLLEATTIVASSTGRTVKDVSERIRSGILGNTEAIEDIGVYAQVAMLKTSKAFETIANGRTWDKLTFQEQQQIRVMSILEQVSDQFGNSVQQNTNYQLMMLTANLKNIALNLGNAFMPIVSVVLPCLNAMALALANVTAKLAAFMNALFGTSFNTGAGEVQQVATGAGEAAQGYSDMADSADKAGDSAKKAGKAAKNALMGFDEVNQLQKDSGGGSGGGGGASPISSDAGVATSNVMSQAAESFADKVQDVIARLKNLFSEGFEIGLGGDFEDKIADIKESVQGIKTSLKDIFTDHEVVASATRLADSIALNLGKISGSVVSIGATIAQNLLGGLDKYLQQNSGFIKDRLVGIMDASSEIANLSGDFAVAFADVFSVFGGETAKQCTANIIAIFSNAFLGSLELAVKFGRDLIDNITKPIIENKDKIKVALENSLSVFETLSGTVSEFVTNTFSKAIEVYDTYISPGLDKIGDGISQVFGSILDAYNTYIVPTLQKCADGFNKLYEEHIRPFVDKFLEVWGKAVNMVGEFWRNVLAPFFEWVVNYLAPTLSTIINAIWKTIEVVIAQVADLLTDLLSILEGIIDFLTGVFTGDWDKAWEGIKEVVKGIGDLLYDWTIGGLQKIVDWLADVFLTCWQNGVEAIKNFFSPLANWFDSYVIQPVCNFFTTLWNGIQAAASACWQGIVTAWQSASSWFSNTITVPIKSSFDKTWGDVKTLASSCVTQIKSTFQGFKTNIDNIISSIRTSFSNLWDSISSGCRGAINGVLSKVESGINGMASKVNSVTSKVGINIPSVKVPKLARGGIVDSATFMDNYIAGEAGKEMIVPLENTAFTDKIATAMGQAVMNAMSVMLNSGGMAGNNGQNLTLEMDGTVFARTMAPLMIKEFKRLGFEI